MLPVYSSYANDFFSFLICVVLIVSYHVFLRFKIKKNPAYTVQAVNTMARKVWVEHVMASDKDILAIQTLRNTTMSATFLASTAVLLILGVLTLSGQDTHLNGVWHILNVIGDVPVSIWLTKLILLLLDLIVSFFSFAMSIRIYNHVGFLINVPLTLKNQVITPAYVATHLNRAGHFYSTGMRAYYFLVPLTFWLFGPYFMLTATVALLVALYYLDRAPQIKIERDID